jgi:hypothetical protein
MFKDLTEDGIVGIPATNSDPPTASYFEIEATTAVAGADALNGRDNSKTISISDETSKL